MSIALVFPGQGSQTVGMLGELAAAFPVVKQTFDEASTALGRDLWQVVQQGPAEELNRTECTQPAMLTAGMATWRVWKQLGGADPAQVSGHSLGEFTALACAEAIAFPDAVALVRDRGSYMQQAVAAGEGAMAAILGLDNADVEAACGEAAEGAVVEAVNFNSPGQVVIAGERAAVERAIVAAKARGAKRAMLLPVSVPAHSSLMRPAAERLRERLGSVRIGAPRFRYVSAVDAKAHADPEELRQLLVRQLASPVRWTGTVQALCAGGATQIAECGPGKVLTALNRRIERRPDLRCSALEDEASIRAAIAPEAGS